MKSENEKATNVDEQHNDKEDSLCRNSTSCQSRMFLIKHANDFE